MSYEYIQGVSQIVASGLFLSVLAGVVIYVFRPANKSRFERAAHLPLDSTPPQHKR